MGICLLNFLLQVGLYCDVYSFQYKLKNSNVIIVPAFHICPSFFTSAFPHGVQSPFG